MTYRSDVPRVSLAQARARFLPRTWRRLQTVRLEHAGVACEVELVTTQGTGAVRGVRKWFACPRCRGRSMVLGFVEAKGWCCPSPSCGGWRSRNRREVALHDSEAEALVAAAPYEVLAAETPR